MIGLFLHHFLILIATLLFFYLTGKFLLKSFGIYCREIYGNLFCSIFSGLTLCVSLFAIIRTHGNTIFIAFLIILLFILFKTRQNQNSSEKIFTRSAIAAKINFKVIAEVFFISLFIFSYTFSIHYNSGYGTLISPSADQMFYGNVGEYISSTGIESFYFDYLNISPYKAVPYHYFELWLNALMTFFTNELSFRIFVLNTTSLLIILFYCGILSFIESCRPLNVFWKLFAIASVWFAGIDLSFGRLSFLSDAGMFCPYMYAGPKYAINAVIVTFMFLLIRQQLYETAIIVVLLLGFSTVSGLPAIIVTLFLFIVANRIFGLKFFKFPVSTIAGIILLTGYFFVFYSINNAGNISGKMVTINELIEYYKDMASIRIFLNIQVKTILQLLCILLPALAIIFLQRKSIRDFIKKTEVVFVLLLFGLVICFTLLSWGVLHIIFGAAQIFTFTSSPLINLSLVLIIFYLINNNGNFFLKKIQSFIYFSICIYFMISFLTNGIKSQSLYTQKFSASYISEVKEAVKDFNNINAVDADASNLPNLFEKNTLPINRTIFMSTFRRFNYTVPLYTMQISLSNNYMARRTEEDFITSSVFYRFIEKQKKNRKFISVSQSKLDFLKTYHIRYLFVDGDEGIEKLYLPYAKKVIVDPNQMHRCIILKDDFFN